MNETLIESIAISGTVDEANGIVRGCKILGLESKNNRRYRPEAARNAVGLYEGVRVNVNHPKGNASEPRDYRDRFGHFRNVTYRESQGLYGDFHFNPKHPIAGQFAWDAQHSPSNAGFSHNIDGRTSRESGRVVVESIIRVRSVDLVADPATTGGIFESAGYAAGEPDYQNVPAEEFVSLLKREPVIEHSSSWGEKRAQRQWRNQLLAATERLLNYRAASQEFGFRPLCEPIGEALLGDGRELFVTMSELKSLLRVSNDSLQKIINEGGVVPAGDPAKPIYSLNAVREALRKLTAAATPTKSTQEHVRAGGPSQDLGPGEFVSLLRR